MADTRNIAHDKKVIQEKKHHGEDPAEGATAAVQPGKKPAIEKAGDHADPASKREDVAEDQAEASGEKTDG